MPPTTGPALTIPDLIASDDARPSDLAALVDSAGRTLTRGGLAAAVADVARRLGAVRVEGSVAISMPQGPGLAVAILAASTVGAAAPINPFLGEAQVEAEVTALGARAVILACGSGHPLRAVAGRLGLPAVEVGDVMERPQPHARRAAGVNGDDVALLLRTSGTTSRAKVVPLTHANLALAASAVAASLELRRADRGVLIMPLFHIHGLVGGLLAPLSVGGSCLCPEGIDPAAIARGLKDPAVTWYTAVPTIHQAILAAVREGGWMPQLRLVRSASAPLSPRLAAEMEAALGCPVLQAYGMTEAAHQIASNPVPPGERRPGSVGLPTGPEVGILAAGSISSEPGRVGEIVVRGRQVTSGYLDEPTPLFDGWLRTGDLGRFDAEGYLFITGRLREMINRGGEKIAPAEVDDALLTHPDVRDAVAFGVDHPTLGQDVAAAVVLQPGAGASPEEIRAEAARHLAPHQVPRRIVVVDRIPVGPSGKFQRASLGELLGLRPSGTGARPATPLEAAIAGVFASILGCDSVGVEDDFFALGGDSLRAVGLLETLSALVAVEVPLTVLVDGAASVRRMAEWISLERGR